MDTVQRQIKPHAEKTTYSFPLKGDKLITEIGKFPMPNTWNRSPLVLYFIYIHSRKEIYGQLL